ncbi:MAG TPA: DUF72 domain-containing protein [Candidatus Polarisedimenticolia bacterium]
MIRTGIAGWDYPDWEGVVYPSPPPRGFDRLTFLTGFFDVIEINVTFYRQPDVSAARSWAARAAGRPGFRFTAKLYQALTHPPRTRVAASPPGRVDLDTEALRFRSGLEPIRAAGLLGAVLAQFPHAFHDLPENRGHLRRLAALLEGLPLVAEFRHRSWDHEEALRFLHDLGVGFCNIDQPALGSTLRPTGHVTSPVAYIRLHGRNAANWFKTGGEGFARYDYLYTFEELRPWIERAERLAERAEEVFIIANNHYRGKGPANALMIASALQRTRLRAPASLTDAFADLRSVAVPEGRQPVQGDLFAPARPARGNPGRSTRRRPGPRTNS